MMAEGDGFTDRSVSRSAGVPPAAFFPRPSHVTRTKERAGRPRYEPGAYGFQAGAPVVRSTFSTSLLRSSR